MVQKNKMLTLEDNRISLTCATLTTTQGDCLAIAEREIPVNATEQTWIFEVGDKTRVSRTTPKLVNSLVEIIKWLIQLGSGRKNDSYLQLRQYIPHSFRAKGIGL